MPPATADRLCSSSRITTPRVSRSHLSGAHDMTLDPMEAFTFLATTTEPAPSVHETLFVNYLFSDTLQPTLQTLYAQLKVVASQNFNLVSFFAFAGILFHVITPLMR